MKTIIDAINTLDKQTAKDLKYIAEQSFECVRKLEETDEQRERIYDILEKFINILFERHIK